MGGGGEGMERGGEGMVAVIRGLQDAGLAVTLTNDLGRPRGTVYAPRSHFPSIPQYPLTQNEGTNTRIPITFDIGAQIRDDRYTSSYQLAHCNQRPSSPPVRLPEFPLRKPDARRSIPAFDVRASEAFAESLRKYPLGERTPSAELINKLLSYTQHRNDANTPKPSRSLPKEKPEREKKRYKDKHIQTYTRTRKMEGIVEEMKSKSFKKMRIHSPDKDSREMRFKDNQLNATYYYLKCMSPPYWRTPEVRYLSDMSKCIKETIRQIVDERPEVCSEMQSRYLAHRKRCQSRSSHKQNGESSQADASQLTVVPFEATDACVSTCPFKAPPCCYCKKHAPLAKRDSKEEFSRKVTEKIGNWLLDIPTYAKMSPEDRQKRIDMAEELANRVTDLKDDEDIEEKARIEVEKCLDEIPMWLPSNKSERDQFKSLVADNLMNKLTRVFEGTDRFDDEITKWIDDIRFKSRDSFGEIIDKDKIADTFADRIKALAMDRPENDDDYHDALKNEVLEMLHELPIETNGNQSIELENLADKLVNNIKSIPASEIKQTEELDKFDKEISKWIDTIEFKRKDSQGNIVDKEEIKRNVMDRLKYLALDRPLDDEDYHESLKNEILDILEELPIETKGGKSKCIEKLASKLANTLKNIPESEIKQKGDKFDEKIFELLKDIKFKKRDSEGRLIDTQKFAEFFSERLKPLVGRPDDDDEYHEAIKNEVMDILEELPIEIEGNKNKYIDKLAEKLTKVIKKIPANETKQKIERDKFDAKISQWLKVIKFKRKDSQGDRVDKEKIMETFIERLKSVAIERPDDDDEYHEALKNEAFDILKDLPIEFEGNKDKFFDKLATRLAKTLKAIPANEIKLKGDKFDETILQWMKDIKFKRKDSQGEIVDKEKIAKSFRERLKCVAINRPEDEDDYHEALRKAALDILEDLPIEFKGDKDKFVNNLATKLAKTLKNIPASEIKPKADKFDEKISQSTKDIKLKKEVTHGQTADKEKSIEKDIEEPIIKDIGERLHEYQENCSKEIETWLEEIPQFSGTKKENARMIDSLSKKLQDLRSEGILDEDEIRDEITDWLVTESNKKGIKMDAKRKDALVTQLAKKIVKVQPPAYHRPSYEIEDEMVTSIGKRLREIPEFIDSDYNRERVDHLAKRINIVRKELGEKVSDDSIRKEVDSWLKDFIKYSGVDPKHKEKLTKDLTSKLKSIIKPNAKLNELKQTINNEVSSIIDRSSHKFSPQAKKNVGRRVSKFLAKNINNIGDDELEQEEIKSNIVRIIDQETEIPDKAAKELAKLFIDRAKRISAIEQRSILKSDSPEEVRAFISDKVKNAVGTLNIDNVEDIEQNITDLLVDQVLNGENADFIMEKIMDLLESANISKEDARDLSMRLELQARDFSSIRRDSTLSLPTEFILNEKEMFQTSAVKEITDFMDAVKGDELDAQTKRNMKIAAQKVAKRLCDTLSDPNQSISEKEEIINKEVFNFLKRFGISVKDHGFDLANRLRNIAATSTPRASMQESFYPRRTGFSVGSIYVPDELKKKVEQNFMSDLEAAIENWILDLPVQIVDKALINNIVKNLASDIADRQKYLQSHPEVKLTEEEELEFLKYQVFRAMGKSVEAEDLATIMSQTTALLAVIKDVLTPVLSKPPLLANEGEVMNKLLEEISMWVEEISSEINKKDIDYDKRQEKVKELAEILHKIAQTKENTAEKIDNEISEWLKSFLKEIKYTNVQSMADKLKNRLKIKGLIKELSEEPSLSGDPLQQDSSQFLEENLSTGIKDWLKSSPLYQRRNTNEKQIQENIIQDLAKDVKKVFQRAISDNLDMEIFKEVKKHIERLPMEPELKSDKAFIDKTSAQLVDYLKNMQMFENVSGRQSLRPVEYLVSTVNDWMKSLLINTKSLGKKEIDDLKMDFIARLSEALKDPNQQDDQVIKNMIKQFLQNLSDDIKKENDPKFIEQKIDQLFKNILSTPFMAPTKRPTISRDLVESAVQNWSKKLPLAPGKTPEQVSDKIQHFVADISSLLEDTNVSAVDNYKTTLHDKTKGFLKKMPVRSEILAPEKLHDLAENLVTTIKEKAAELSPKPIRNKNAADLLYDNITTWCEDLPLFEGSTPEEKERVKAVKHNLASKLMNKIGELNMNPEILNDDALYEHLIQEEINDLLSDLSQGPEMEANIESIKENLMSKVKEIKQKTQDESAGQTYKQQLRDTISKTLPFDAELSAEGPEPFEILVDNLADAYVNLNFINDGTEQRAAYKKKIADEITKYCNDYLKRHPESPIDSAKLNRNLFNALKSIKTPKEEILRSEAEQVRMKDEINDWIKELPLTSDSGPEAVQINKMASVLAKKLVEIEKEKEANPNVDYEEKAHKEIAKLIKKLPIAPGHEAEMDDMIKHFIEKIQGSEQSRRISASTTRQSIDLGSEPGESSTQPSFEDLPSPCCRKIKQKQVCNKNVCNYNPTIPASTLSAEDRAHLVRIRLRNQPCEFHKVCNCKDASVSPLPIDVGSQTEVTPIVPSVCTKTPISPRLSPCMPAPPCVQVPPCSGSEQEVSPQIIIKEYLWDSGTSKLLGPVYRLPCLEVDTSNPTLPSLQRPFQKTVSIQPSPCSFPETPSCSTPRQTSPRTCFNISRAPCSDEITSSSPLRPCINLGTSPCQSPHQLSTARPCSAERTSCLPSLKPCHVSSGSSPCRSPYQIQTPCAPPLRPCINLGTSPSPIQIPPQRSPCPTRPCLGRSPCQSPHQISTPKPCITLPRPVISSQPSPCPNQTIHTIPYPEIPYCSTPRRRFSRDPNAPFRHPTSRAGSRIDRENEGPNRVFRPRVINVGDEDSPSPCRRRNEDESISEYKDKYRPYRVASRDYTQTQRDDRMRCCKCNHRIRNVCQRHRSPNCPSTENVRHCSKCCGLPCPHPTGMFFK